MIALKRYIIENLNKSFQFNNFDKSNVLFSCTLFKNNFTLYKFYESYC